MNLRKRCLIVASMAETAQQSTAQHWAGHVRARFQTVISRICITLMAKTVFHMVHMTRFR